MPFPTTTTFFCATCAITARPDDGRATARTETADPLLERRGPTLGMERTGSFVVGTFRSLAVVVEDDHDDVLETLILHATPRSRI